jgi:hypothetical protein
MNFRAYPFRHADVVLREDNFIEQFEEICAIIQSISDKDLIEKHLSYGNRSEEKIPKSLSKAINEILKDRFETHDWSSESSIFQDNRYSGEVWRLDFAKKDISIEVAFNHSTVIAWNLIKPVLASELNHVQKAIQTQIGVIITVTSDLKQLGGFDSAVGTYEKFIDHLPPLSNILTVPILIIGLEPPSTFKINHEQIAPRKKIGRVVYT